MKIFLALLFIVSNALCVSAQVTSIKSPISDKQQIIEVINNYIVGTSYSYPDQVKSAFIPGAQMFLDKEGEPLFVLTIEQYAGGVGKGTAGEFNGRVTNILSIDIFEGIATAKLEVLIAGLNKRFIDMLLLKKFEDGWKIISKTAASEPSSRNTEKVLIVTSSATHDSTGEIAVGNSFSEVAESYYEYQKAGYHVDIISPNGGKITLSYINPSDSAHIAALYDSDFMYALSSTKKPSEIKQDAYNIILYTGGSAPIFDIPQNVEIQQIAQHIYEKNKGVIAAVCHGTAGIVNIKTSDGKYIVANKTINGYPNEYENKDSKLYKKYPIIIEDEIEKNGGKFTYGESSKAFHITDGRLVTGQNYLSSSVVVQKSIEVLTQIGTKR